MHTDNENWLNYEVTDIRRHRTRKGFQIVVDRKCLVRGATDTIYALDAAAMRTAEALTAPVVELAGLLAVRLQQSRRVQQPRASVGGCSVQPTESSSSRRSSSRELARARL